MPPLITTCVRHALDCQVYGFGRPRGPDDLIWPGLDQLGDLLPGILDGFGGLLSWAMRIRCGVAEDSVRTHVLDHRIHNRRIHWGRCGIV